MTLRETREASGAPDEVVELPFRARRRSLRAVAALVVPLLALGAWWFVSGTATVGLGASSHVGGHQDLCPYADEDFWAVFARDETAVAIQTVRNDARWSVEVTSARPDAFRFGPLAADPRDDVAIPDLAGGPHPPDETTDRVTILPGREVVMWIVDPVPARGEQAVDGQDGRDRRRGIDGAELRVRSLGITRDVRIDFGRWLWVSELTSDSPTFQDEVALLCEDRARR